MSSGTYKDPKDVDDLSTLDNLDNDVILFHLQKRFENGIFYTYIGDVLVAFNPCRSIPIYGEEFHRKYKDLRVRQNEQPHIYYVADVAYRNLLESQFKQCVVVTGDSGAGKTETTKYVLKHLTNRAKCAIPDLVDRLSTVNPLIEMFGNAATVFNPNSSRFGKLIELQYTNIGELLGGRIQTFVLEKSRVVYHGIGEKNFHIFHSLIAGMDEQKLLYYYIENPTKYRILHENGVRPDTSHGLYSDPEEMMKYYKLFTEAEDIMRSTGFSDEDVHNLYQILSAILNISNIEFEEDEETSGLIIANENHLLAGNEMLRLPDHGDLTAALITNTTYVNGEEIKSFKSIRQAEDGRDSVCKELYRCLFTGIIEKVNDILKPTGAQRIRSGKTLSIGILDISGFENLQHNSFEQLLINITNEKLHQYFQQQIFDVEYKDYKLEGIEAHEINFLDNRDVLNLLFKELGILSILDEEMVAPGSSDVSLVNKYNKYLKDSPCYRQRGNTREFAIIHYAGQVQYIADGFLDKNRGTLSRNLKQCLFGSENTFVVKFLENNSSAMKTGLNRGDSLSKSKARELSKSISKDGGKHRSGRGAAKMYDSEAHKYRQSLNELNDKLSQAKPMFIRCVKPNLDLTRDVFDTNTAGRQLKASGILEVTKIRKDGYPLRLKFDFFIDKYAKAMKADDVNADPRSKAQSILQNCGVKNYKLGKTKVFMKTGDADKLEMHLENMRKKALIEKTREEVNKKLPPSLSSDSGNTSLSSSHYSDKKDPNLFINIPDVAIPVDYSLPNTPDGEYPTKPPDSSSANDKTQRPAWDIFRVTERDIEGCGNFENKFLKGCRLFTEFIIFVLVFVSGIASVGSLLLMSANLNEIIHLCITPSLLQSFIKNNTATELVMCFACPIAFTWIASLFSVLFGRSASIKKRFLIPALVIDAIHAAGTALLVYRVLPNFDIVTNLTIMFAIGQAPALLNLFNQVTRKRKFILRFVAILFAFLALVAQFIINPFIYGVGMTSYWSEEPHLANTPLEFTDAWCLSLAIFLISLGWIENFINSDIFGIPFVKWRKSLNKSRDKVILFSEPIKVGIFIGLTFILVSGTQLSLSVFNNSTSGFNETIKTNYRAINITDINVTNFFVNNTKLSLDGIDDFKALSENYALMTIRIMCDMIIANHKEMNIPEHIVTKCMSSQNKHDAMEEFKMFFEKYGLMLIQILCSLTCSYCACLACKLQMQRVAFYLPLISIIPTIFGLSIYACSNFATKQPILEGQLLCPRMDLDLLLVRCVLVGVLELSVIILTWHEIFPKAERMAKLKNLFILPVRDGVFTVMGLLLRRRDDMIEDEMCKKENERRKKDVKKERPMVHICATMWHENRNEMLQLLKSLFRIDAYKSQGQIAEKKFKVHVDYFDVDIHVIFDDAFEPDKDTKERVPNFFVQQFLECMGEAVVSVAKGHIDWEKNPKKITTPYGGRLKWNMPGGTKLYVHLKDKNKIRHRKRWSQIMYMYYLLGYKRFKSQKETEIITDRVKHHLIRPFTSILNRVQSELVNKVFNTFILTLDGDVDFRPEAVQLLIDRMRKNEKVAAVCGRIHPIGSGPMVWYQQFEYAVGHWLQKAAEHVFGCVLCCPGCFSLFRVAALMDDNVVKMYTRPPTEATHYIQFEQGEDRWLCTLLLQQGWKIDYCAGADALTYAPETFKDFYIQRRRWAPSTLANIMDLLSSWATTTKMNDNISTPFIFYQFLLMAASLLSPGTVSIMITGSYASVLGIHLWYSYLLSIFPVLGYIIVCLTLKNNTQIFVAGILSSIYSIVMVIVTIGTILDVTTSVFLSPNVMFLSGLSAIFVISALLHPKEIGCLVHGILYFLTVPSSFVFLTVYYLCNLHIVTWGTRESKHTTNNDENKNKKDKNFKQKGLSIVKSLGITNCVKEIITFVKHTIGSANKGEEDNAKNLNPMQQQTMRFQKVVTPPLPPPTLPKPKVPLTRDDNVWKNVSFLKEAIEGKLKADEVSFWEDIMEKYLHPIEEDENHKQKIKDDLLTLRNNVVFGYFLLNLLFTIALLQLQLKEDQLKSFYIVGEYEPFSVAFLCVFALVIFIQFLGMLCHRWGTFLHLISSVQIDLCKKNQNEEYFAKLAFQEAGKLQSVEPEPDYLAQEKDSDSEAVNNSASTSSNNTLSRVEVPVQDYSDEEIEQVVPLGQHRAPPSAYERNFVKRYRTIRHQYKKQQTTHPDYSGNPRHRHPFISNSVQRNELYQRTFGRNYGRRHNYV